MQVTLYNYQPLEKRTFFNPLLCTISIWKALRNRPKAESKKTKQNKKQPLSFMKKLLHTSTNIGNTQKYQTSQWKEKHSFLSASSFTWFQITTTLITFQRGNTSAEWIKKRINKYIKNKLVKDVNRAAGSVSATRAEWQYGGQWTHHCHQPVIDIQSPAQLACQHM